MEYLRFIFYLGVIYITFDVLWNLFLFILRVTFDIRKKENFLYHILKALSYYLLVSLTAATTIRYMTTYTDPVKQFFFSFVGLLVLYFYITSAMHKSRIKAAMRSDVIAMRRMQYNSIYLFASVVFYISALYLPSMVETLVLDWLFNTIENIYHVLLFRWVIGFMAFLFLINVLYNGILTTRTLIMSLFGIKPKSTSSYRDMYGRAAPYEETIEVDYQEVPDDEEDDMRDDDNIPKRID